MKLFYLLIFFTLLIHRPVQGQGTGQNFFFQQYTDENGLPQNSVQGLTMDDAGFVWIATQGGLVRFDGQKMVTFTKKDLGVKSDRFIRFKNEMQTGLVYAVNEFRQLVSMTGGIARYDKKYASDYDLDLAAIRSRPARIRPQIQVDTARNADSYMQYRVIYGAPGDYYLYADEKIGFFENGTLTGVLPLKGKAIFAPLPPEPHLRQKAILETRGDVYVDNLITIGASLFYHKGGEGPQLSALTPNGAREVELDGAIRRHPAYATSKGKIRIIVNRFNAQAFAYLDGSLYLITFSEKSSKLDTQLLLEGLDLDQKMVYRMLYDESNRTLFLGSLTQGLFVARAGVFNTYGQAAKRGYNNYFYAQLPFSDSTVLIPEGYLIGKAGIAGDLGPFFRDGRQTLNFGMLADRAGNFWTIKSDSICHIRRNGQLTDIWKTGKHPERLYQGRDGRIWIGFRTGEIAWLPPSATSTDKLTLAVDVKAWSTFIYEDKSDRLWLGTNKGLFVFDRHKKKAFPVKGLSDKNIRSIYASGPDELWITTYGDGMYLLTGNSLIRLPLDARKYLAYAHCILEDGQGNFWISSNKGLFRVARKDLADYAAGKLREVFYVYYNKDHGFLTNEFNGGCQPCGLKLGDGHLSFPSMNGLVWFRPEHVPMPDLHAPLLLESFRLDEQPVAASDTVQLPYDFAHLAIGVSSPFMGLADNLQIFYKIQKSSRDSTAWVRMEPGKGIDVYRLDAGTYTLAVKKLAGFGGNAVEKRVILNVGRAWFVSWWFALLAVSVLALTFWLLTKWRLRSLTRQNVLLSRKVEERTANLSKTLDELKASEDALQMQLQIQMRIIGVINHDLHSPLRYLSIHVPQYTDQVAAQLKSPDTNRLGNSISKSTVKVFKLADELLKFIKSTYNKKGNIAYEQVLLPELIEAKAQFFAELAQENHAVLEVAAEPGLCVHTNRIMAEILIHNLIDNALKHSFGHSVTITARQESGKAVVTVKDSGQGMYPEIIEWLSNHEGGSGNGREAAFQPPPSLGLGLIIVREITMLLGIKLVAKSTVAGTEVRVELP